MAIVTVEDICDMGNDYMEALWRADGVEKYPLVIAHDRQNGGRVAEIVKKYKAVVYTGELGLEVDTQLMMHARHMIGNPGSTLSWNVAVVRALRNKDPMSNLNVYWSGESCSHRL